MKTGEPGVEGAGQGGEEREVSRFEVGAEQRGRRLDQVLVDLVPSWSRSRLQALVKAGHVRVDGRTTARSNHLLEGPATIEVALLVARPHAFDVAGAPIGDLPVLFEDEDVAVIDKPAGLVSHPRLSAGGPAGAAGAQVFGALSVSDLATARFGALPVGQGMGRPGIVHRLDRLTSGVMVLARTEAAMLDLMRQFRHRTVQKTYAALVHGVPRFDTQWVDAPLAPRPDSPDRQRVASREQIEAGAAREAETFVEVRERFAGFSSLTCQPKTGRTHQIRVHLQHLNLPIIGDRIYHARGALSVKLPEDAPVPQRQALHAAALTIDHPRTGERLTFEAPLPDDMQRLLAWLRAHAPASR
ncbi:MAG: RluA family pseudouridine synthase [Planctomycetota bacterium]